MKRFEFNKLVRHKLPARMTQEGIFVNGRNLSEEEYITKLKQKLIEEAKEVELADDKYEIKRELADVLEVIYTLGAACDISIEEIQEERVEKSRANGVFSKECYINYIEVPEDNKKAIEYMQNKNRAYVF